MWIIPYEKATQFCSSCIGVNKQWMWIESKQYDEMRDKICSKLIKDPEYNCNWNLNAIEIVSCAMKCKTCYEQKES